MENLWKVAWTYTKFDLIVVLELFSNRWEKLMNLEILLY